ncbi:MAG: amidohydrolase family protein [Bacteroidota bacterium]
MAFEEKPAIIIVGFHANDLLGFEKIEAILTSKISGFTELQPLLQMMTLNPAILSGQDKLVGSLEEGKLADLVIVDRNLSQTAADSIGKTQVLATIFEGDPVFDPESIFSE